MMIETFDYSVNITQAILWQYNEAVNLISLLNSKQAWYDTNQESFWADWYNDVFNLLTANAFGLVVWSIILDVPLYLNTGTDDRDSLTLFGFNVVESFPTDENTYENFNGVGTSSPNRIGANFSNIGTRLILTLEEQRFILRLRYFQLVTGGNVPDINTFLNYLFTTSPAPFTGTGWVLDGFDMTMTYVFNFPIPRTMLTILQALDLLPRPEGVGIKYIVTTVPVFGFNEVISFPTDENTNQNFLNGNFFSANNY